MSFFIATLLKSGVNQDKLEKLTRNAGCQLKYNLSHLSMRKKPTIWRASS